MSIQFFNFGPNVFNPVPLVVRTPNGLNCFKSKLRSVLMENSLDSQFGKNRCVWWNPHKIGSTSISSDIPITIVLENVIFVKYKLILSRIKY